MQDFGSTPSLLKRPLRGTRRRVSTRRKVLLSCVGLIFIVFIALISRSSTSGTTFDAITYTTSKKAVPHSPTHTITTHPTSKAPTSTAMPPTTTTTTLMPKDATGYGPGKPIPRGAFQHPWILAPSAAAAQAGTGAVDAAEFESVVGTHRPGTAWRDDTTNQIFAFAKSGAVVLATPTITVCHHRDDYQRWESVYQPNETYQIPAWSAPSDRDTLQHASIFTSLAAFRDSECTATLRDLFDMAAAPHRLYVGISEERKPSDASCLAMIGVADLNSGQTRKLLYGPDAPASIELEMRSLSWPEIVAPRKILDVDAVLNVSVVPSDGPIPEGIYLLPSHTQERLLCVAGELETLRDRLLLSEDEAKQQASGGTVFRQGRGGPQQQPSRALAGCRVTTRVTDPQLARGPTFGRYITSLFFFDQDYFMVVDSHTRFSVHWDAKLITRIFQLRTPGVLSYYPNGYREGFDREEYHSQSYMLMCLAQVLNNGMPKLGARWKPVGKHPVVQGFAAAGFMFGDAQFVLDTPFDPFLPYMFDGEEVLFSARMWTGGWDIYGPAESNIFHYYVRPKAPKYFSIMRAAEAQRRVKSEQRTLHILRRAHPWVEELVRRGYLTSDGQTTLKPLPSYEPPETRLIVSDEMAAKTRELNVYDVYYGVGKQRTLAQYWHHTQLTDEFVKKKDNENRWMGGEGLCADG